MKNVGQFNFGAVYVLLLCLSVPTTAISDDSLLIAQGQDLYETNCVFCHQADAIGKAGFAPSLTNPEFLSSVSDEFLLGTIRDGRPGTGMPPFAHLGEDGIRAIGVWLRAHSELPDRSTEIDSQPEARGDPRAGKLLFDGICATCHGSYGDGYIAGGTGTAIGKAGFLNMASDGFIRNTIKYGRSNTRMLGFSGPAGLANLTDQEIDDIIVYLRELEKQNH
ncbi:MAG: c-type cytochrome [Gammaproteobacteria bacterium]|nr:c-type cytochrome [Gammaproteobacteria bacterium]